MKNNFTYLLTGIFMATVTAAVPICAMTPSNTEATQAARDELDKQEATLAARRADVEQRLVELRASDIVTRFFAADSEEKLLQELKRIRREGRDIRQKRLDWAAAALYAAAEDGIELCERRQAQLAKEEERQRRIDVRNQGAFNLKWWPSQRERREEDAKRMREESESFLLEN